MLNYHGTTEGFEERTAAIFRVKKVQEDREKTATLAYENRKSKILRTVL